MVDCTTCKYCTVHVKYHDMYNCMLDHRLSLFTIKEIDSCADYISLGCEYCRGCAYTNKPFKVTTQLGAVRETQFNYCPSCGRQIKP